MSKFLKYLLLGIALVPATIVAHELGHFLIYHLFGAENVRLRAFSVSADKEKLTDLQVAAASIAGPLVTYATIALGYFFTQKTYNAAWIIVALAAPLGRIVNFVYIYFRLAGDNPKPNFDEFNFSRNVGIEPLILSVVTAFLVLATFAIFFGKAWREGKFKEIGLLVVSLIAGVAVWNFVGGYLLP